MSDEALSQLVKLNKGINDAGLKTTSMLLTKVFFDRSPAENEVWDKETRQVAQNKAIEALGSGIHTQPILQVEIPVSDLVVIHDLPPIKGGKIPGASSNTEIRALEAVGAIRVEGENVSIPDPPRFLGGLKSFLSDTQTLTAFGQQLGIPGVFEEVFEPVQKRLTRIISYNNFLKIYSNLSIVYGVRVRTIPAAEVYRSACTFVKKAGSATALTNSTTAGAIDPLERFGTEDVAKRLGINSTNELKKKDAFRIQNFSDGLLNPIFSAKRPYFFDRQETSKAMKSTLSLLPDNKKIVYKEMAAICLKETLSCPWVDVFEVEHFEPWMWRLTRSAPGYVLISLRHRETKAIDEGIELTFKSPEKTHDFYQQIFRVASLGSSMKLPPLATSVIVASGIAENILFKGISKTILFAEAEKDLLAHSKKIAIREHYPNLNLPSAEEYINSLC